jgi:energy-coupling factor transporter ATP-binding protein EcfA2
MPIQNPFNPTFDYQKESYIDDNQIAGRLIQAIDHVSDPWHTTLIMGMRGCGKTTTLTYVKNQIIKEKNVIVVQSSSNNNLLENIIGSLQKSLSTGISLKEMRVKLPGVELNIDAGSVSNGSFQVRLIELLEVAKLLRKKIVLLIDEVQNTTEQLSTFFSAYRTVVSDGLPIMVVAAGLPSAIYNVINDDALTFLLRANRVELQPLKIKDVRFSFLALFTRNDITFEQAQKMADQTKGYPFMYQLIGYAVWEMAKGGPITDTMISNAVKIAKEALFEQVYSKVWYDVTATAQELITAIHDLGEVGVQNTDLKNKLGWDTNKLSTYKSQLIHWGLIRKEGRGIVSFDLPYFGEFLDEYFD